MRLCLPVSTECVPLVWSLTYGSGSERVRELESYFHTQLKKIFFFFQRNLITLIHSGKLEKYRLIKSKTSDDQKYRKK